MIVSSRQYHPMDQDLKFYFIIQYHILLIQILVKEGILLCEIQQLIFCGYKKWPPNLYQCVCGRNHISVQQAIYFLYPIST